LLQLNLSNIEDPPGPILRAFESALPPEFSDVLVRAEGNADTAVALAATLVAVPLTFTVLGRAVQVGVGPMNPVLKAPGTSSKRLKLKFDVLLSTSAFKFNLRRYTSAR